MMLLPSLLLAIPVLMRTTNTGKGCLEWNLKNILNACSKYSTKKHFERSVSSLVTGLQVRLGTWLLYKRIFISWVCSCRQLKSNQMYDVDINYDTIWHFSDYCNRLPDEVLLMIFGMLSKSDVARCSCVCTRWRSVSYEKQLWDCVHLERKKVPLHGLANLIQRGVKVLKLKFSHVLDRGESNTFMFPPYYQSRLQHLDLSWTTITEISLLAILRHTQQLVKISLWNCKVNLHICEAIAANSHLQEIDLFGCEGLDAQGLTAILTGCPRIKYFGLAYTKLSLETLDVVTSRLKPSIVSLDFMSYGLRTLLDRHIIEVVRTCPNLQYLNIRFNAALTQETDLAIRNLPFLVKYYR